MYIVAALCRFEVATAIFFLCLTLGKGKKLLQLVSLSQAVLFRDYSIPCYVARFVLRIIA